MTPVPLEFNRVFTQDELTEWAVPLTNAYPAMTEPLENVAKRLFEVSKDPAVEFWSALENGRLVGGMETLHLEMNFLGTFVKAAGVGEVWVDFLQKKRGIAKAIIERFLDYTEEAGASLALLYPFRPDFYRKMGFGYGAKQERYIFNPAGLPGTTPHGLVYLTEDDAPLIQACRDEEAARRHGHARTLAFELAGLFRSFGERRRVVGYKENRRLRGFMAYGFRRYDTSFIKNDMVIYYWVWDSPETLMRFSAFLRSQADQVHRIEFCTQDAAFHLLLGDVRDGSDNLIRSVYHQSNTAGIGLMYRIVNVEEFLRETAFRDYGGQTADVVLQVEDTFRPANAGTYRLSFREGRLNEVRREPAGPSSEGVHVSLEIGDLSALLMGSATIESLHRYGRARLSREDGALELLGRLFAAERPTCLTSF